MAYMIDHPCVQHKLAIIRDEETGHKRFRELATEMKKELEAKIKKMQEEFHESILDELSPEQRKRYRELLGDKVATFDPPKKPAQGNKKEQQPSGR